MTELLIQKILETSSARHVDQLDEVLLNTVAELEYRVCILELFGGIAE